MGSINVTQGNTWNLNDWSGEVLQNLASVGGWAERNGLVGTQQPEVEQGSFILGTSSVAEDIAKKADSSFINGQIKQNTLLSQLNQDSQVKEILPSNVKPGMLGKFLSKAGAVTDACTGTLSVLAELNRDMQKGDTSYTNTTKEIVLSTGQLGASAAVGYGVAAATAVVTGAATTAVLPVVAGVAVGAAAAYVVGKGVDMVRNWWKD